MLSMLALRKVGICSTISDIWVAQELSWQKVYCFFSGGFRKLPCWKRSTCWDAHARSYSDAHDDYDDPTMTMRVSDRKEALANQGKILIGKRDREALITSDSVRRHWYRTLSSSMLLMPRMSPQETNGQTHKWWVYPTIPKSWEGKQPAMGVRHSWTKIGALVALTAPREFTKMLPRLPLPCHNFEAKLTLMRNNSRNEINKHFFFHQLSTTSKAMTDQHQCTRWTSRLRGNASLHRSASRPWAPMAQLHIAMHHVIQMQRLEALAREASTRKNVKPMNRPEESVDFGWLQLILTINFTSSGVTN